MWWHEDCGCPLGVHANDASKSGTRTASVDTVERDLADHVVFDRVSKSFGSAAVICDLDLRLERHAITALIGGSGSGKTTIGRMLVGLTPVTSGHIRVDGVDMDTLSERELMRFRRCFGVVFQSHALLDSMTVLDNVAFPLREHHREVDASEVEARVVASLQELGIVGKEHCYPSELSGGQRKRVAIARALILHPKLVLYDEPTTGLDPDTSRGVDHLIVETRRKHRVTSVVITHDVATCFRVADHVIVLAGGRIIAEGTARELAAGTNETARQFFAASGIREEQLGRIERA